MAQLPLNEILKRTKLNFVDVEDPEEDFPIATTSALDHLIMEINIFRGQHNRLPKELKVRQDFWNKVQEEYFLDYVAKKPKDSQGRLSRMRGPLRNINGVPIKLAGDEAWLDVEIVK